jgi:hypothetical protein
MLQFVRLLPQAAASSAKMESGFTQIGPSSSGHKADFFPGWFVASRACTKPNYISINTAYQANPNAEYIGAREGRNDQLNTNVSKNFALVEGMAFQMRIDAFNVFTRAGIVLGSGPHCSAGATHRVSDR